VWVATSRVTGVSTALYRRYRPETFAEVIGQDHVTAPLMQALRSGRVNHAYLFSGPRGCGKTTSARILARTLNCERNTPESPLDTPCGQCPSCVELARGGPGSLDVVEIDAASHNGVDDARELRERAAFAPARDRYKIFILDEAHMVTPQGFNALLKLVEEPPEHVKFVFATTEPDKVIGTIRSRTHHYPFRLVPPDVLGPYLEELCAAEGVSIGSGVVPLVTRAGGGSVRDSLSVMDQLIAGAEDGAVEYERAVALLGFTHATLLDDVVDALAARDGASIFRVVDHVIATGHEPRRFVEDVLERLRDLIVIAVSGDEAQAVLRDQPADQLERMRTQAQHLGVAELSRAADLVNAALTEMTGATSPRLHLELLMARLLLPGADDGAAGFAARLDRLERGGLGNVVVPPAAGTAAPGDGGATATAPAASPVGVPSSGLTGAAAVRAALRPPRPAQAAAGAPVVQDPTPVGRVGAPSAPEQDRPSGDGDAAVSPAAASPAAASHVADGARASADDGAGSAVGSSAPADSSAPREETAPAEASVPERTGPVSGAASARPGTAPDATSSTVSGTTSVSESEASADRARDTAASAAPADAPSPAPEAPHHEASRHETSREEAPREDAQRPSTPREAAPRQEAAAPSAPAAGGASAALTTEELRRRWPEVLENLRASPVTWSLVSANAQVAELGADVLYLAFPSPGLARTFSSSRHTSAVQDVVYQTLGLQVRVEPRLDEGGQPGGGSAPSSGPAPASPAPSTAPAPAPAPGAPVSGGPASGTAAPAVAAGLAVSRPAGSASASAGAAALHGPGGSQATVPVATVVAPSTPGTARSASTSRPADEAAAAHETPRAAVALQERPGTETAPAAPPVGSTVVDAADEAWLAGASAPTPAPEPRADSADEAWLAGLPAEPPADLDDGPEPEPVLEPASAPTPTATQTPARTAPSGGPAPSAPGRPGAVTPAGPRQEAPARTAAPAAPAGPSAAPLRGVSAARAAIAAARVPRTEEPARRGETSAVDPMDDLPSADDPDIVSTGLVGTALVVSLLDGKIIEEIQDQG
jgi:DNA polymerase III subunit gamma/tau